MVVLLLLLVLLALVVLVLQLLPLVHCCERGAHLAEIRDPTPLFAQCQRLMRQGYGERSVYSCYFEKLDLA